jgi:5-methylcytosine-specific restriction protein A
MPRINLGKGRRPRVRTSAKREAQRVYQDRRWKRLREYKLRENPLCERCEAAGKSKLATEVHHKIPFSQGNTRAMVERLAFDFDNTESLCTQCHSEEHNKKTEKS